MKGQVIGKTMPHGYAGSYSRQPGAVVDTHPLAGEDAVPFGAALVYGTGGAVVPFGGSSTAEAFLGVAVREVKSAMDYLDQNTGLYRPGEAVPVMKLGSVNVVCQNGTPVTGGAVYVRTKASAAYPAAAVGGFEAAEDTGNSVKLANAQWKGSADASRVAELCILTRNNA
jgi:hypothetical protein